MRWIEPLPLAVAVVLGVPGVVLGILAARFETFPGDRQASALVRELGEGFEPVAFVLNELDAVLAVVLIGAAAIRLGFRRRAGAVITLLAIVAMRPLLGIAKDVVGRPRPSADFPIRDVVDNASFPSGHVMTAVIMFGAWFVFAPELVPPRAVATVRVAAVLGVLLMSIARMWTGVHWFSDTYGAVLWAGAAMALAMSLRPAFGWLAAAVANRVRGERRVRA